MLNRWVRYFPILRELEDGGSAGLILEVGSGSLGLGEFLPAPFVGCDLLFDGPTRSPNLLPVCASGAALPFPDGAFDTVLCLDTLEHVERRHRLAVLREAVRVARSIVIVGAPMGERALKADQALSGFYRRMQRPVPLWLEEHMTLQDEFPTRGEMMNVIGAIGARFDVREGESARFHFVLSVLEALPGIRSLLALLSRSPWNSIIVPLLKPFNRSGTYRTYFIVRK